MAPSDDTLRAILLARPVIAMVGASSRPERPSHGVMRHLLDAGYEVHPVNPNERSVHGVPAWPDLGSAPRAEVVDVFRRADATPDVARAAVAAGARMLWLQLGVINHDAGRIARDAGLIVVMDRCLWVEHERLIGTPHPPR